MRISADAAVATSGGHEPRPLVALLTWIIARDWALALLGDTLVERVVTLLLSADDERAAIAALGQIDRLDGWSDVVAALIDDPCRERLVLTALATMPRLDGPYASHALAEALHRRILRALAAPDPADALWLVSLDAMRWLRLAPALGRLSLAVPDSTRTLGDVAERLRAIARAVEAHGGLAPDLRARAAALPENTDAAETRRSGGNSLWPTGQRARSDVP